MKNEPTVTVNLVTAPLEPRSRAQILESDNAVRIDSDYGKTIDDCKTKFDDMRHLNFAPLRDPPGSPLLPVPVFGVDKATGPDVCVEGIFRGGEIIWSSDRAPVKAPCQHITDAAWERVADDTVGEDLRKCAAQYGVMLVTVGEWEDRQTLNRQPSEFHKLRVAVELQRVSNRAEAPHRERANKLMGRIGGAAGKMLIEALCDEIERLEADAESLSRQLRSRERNREPERTKPVFRWGRPV